ncbi:cytochrome b (plasmid) [Cronobacter dublinensis]|uniref:cytochrome b n=1 Tax=Cronobacter dublinensis TaxID=413497 RepID=UPI00293099E7|nr:cytochrome b [Cronobacter dublinensis]WNY85034.1 cytochrome b [Cronobacter dublinensis]
MAELHLPVTRKRYDSLTLLLHWLTAACVIFLFASAHVWEWLERGTPLRKGLQAVHISCGILLTLIVVVRLAWRFTGRRSPSRAMPAPAGSPATRLLAGSVHAALYGLLAAQIVLGFLFRWAQHEPFTFFGLVDLSGWVEVSPALRHDFGEWHNAVAWAIIALVFVHALAALMHHYLLKDDTLRRMMPGRATTGGQRK